MAALAGALLAKEMAAVLPLLLVTGLLAVLKWAPRRGWAFARFVLLEALWAVTVVGWLLWYRQCVPGRMGAIASGGLDILPSTWMHIVGCTQPELTIFASWLRAHPDLTCLVTRFWQKMAVGLALWTAMVIWLARREWRLLVVYLAWGAITWVPLVSTHTAAPHYLHVPELARYMAYGATVGLALTALRRRGLMPLMHDILVRRVRRHRGIADRGADLP